MFSSKKQLIKKTGKHGVGRFNFLTQLVEEFKATKSRDAKEQVLANLANFAYDPVNYSYLWRLKVCDLFFSELESKNKKLVSFAIGGICNICSDPLQRQYILRNNGIEIISSLLTNSQESVVLSSITTLIYLNTPESKNLIASPSNVQRMLELSKSPNRRIKNLADIFLQDFCQITPPKESTVITNSNVKVGASTSTASTSTATSSQTNIENSTSLFETQSEDTKVSEIEDITAGLSTSTATF